MKFSDIINAGISKEADRPMMKKELYPPSDRLKKYLQRTGRDVPLPINYAQLLDYRYSDAIRGADGKLTHWETAVYDLREMEQLKESIIETYAVLKTEGNMRYINHLEVERIDFCEFGNSVPFRIRVKNKVNGNTDHFYIKAADASRIYGLELEHLLSPNYILYLHHNNTLVEEHIPGIPGDIFLERHLTDATHSKIRLAKEFVKFNERCFARLLGDMRSYNFVVDITPDIEDYQYRFRAIDFDQQCYEGNKKLYLPQFYKENYDFVKMVMEELSPDVIEQYQTEERTSMAYRAIGNSEQLMDLLDTMAKEELSENYKIKQLREELNLHFGNSYFSKCNTMGALVKRQLKMMIQKHLKNLKGKRR